MRMTRILGSSPSRRRLLRQGLTVAAALSLTWWLRRPRWGVRRGARAQAAGDEPMTYGAGSFRLTIQPSPTGPPRLRIGHLAAPARVLWESPVTGGFLAAAIGQAAIQENRAPASGFAITDTILTRCDQQTVGSIEAGDQSLTLRGTLAGDGVAISYAMTFTALDEAQLRFAVELVGPGVADFNRLFLRAASTAEERFFGFGAQLTYLDQKGRVLPILVQEHGVGRGLPVVTELVEQLVGPGSAGAWYTTEIAVPQYLSSQGRALCLETTEYCIFDLSAADRTEIELFAPAMSGRIFHGQTPLDLIEAYTRYAGRMRPLPDWVHDGAIIGVQGGTAVVRAKVEALVQAQAPVAALWMQDWVGQRQTSVGSQLWWNWQLDTSHYPDWDELRHEFVERLAARALIYINPFLTDAPGHDQLFTTARDAGYFVRTATGAPYLIPNSDFSAGLIDLSNPAARSWIKQVIKDEMIGRAGAAGWMADFGEALPFDAQLASGESPAAWHNRYPEEWATVNREAAAEAGLELESVIFHRSGYTRSPGIASLFWLGDQLQTWDDYDGMKTAVTGALSAGFSGFSLTHTDTGGYDSIRVPPSVATKLPPIARSKELLMRWMELSAFTPVFRTHEGIDPAAAWQFDSDAETLAFTARMAAIYRAWGFYRRALVAEAARRGYPVQRHLFLHYPDDPVVRTLQYQYLLGSELLVAPVLDEGADRVRLYLPAGDWTHLWTDETSRATSGRWIEVPAPLGQPAVFARADSVVGVRFRAALQAAGIA